MTPFPLPVLFTAWVWHDGAGIAGEVIRRAKLGGFKTVAVQLRESTPDDATDEGRTLDPSDVRAMQAAGLKVVGWDSVAANTAHLLETLPLDGWVPQVETPDQRKALQTALMQGVGRGIPTALVTTYGGLDTVADVAAFLPFWADRGGLPLVFVECYKADGFPHEQIDRMLAQGAVYGFDRSKLRALVGTYRGELPTDYPGLDAADYGGAYLEENMSDAQLTAFKQIVPTTVTPPPTPEPPVSPTPDPAVLNTKIAGLADSWLAAHDGPDTLARLRSIYRIATSTDEEWNDKRGDVVAALDGDITVPPEVLAELDKLRASVAERDSRISVLVTQKAALERRIAGAKRELG